MNRRELFKGLIGTLVGGILLEEIPLGRSFVSLYTPDRNVFTTNGKILTATEVVMMELDRIRPKLPVLFDRDDVFFKIISRDLETKTISREMRIPLDLFKVKN